MEPSKFDELTKALATSTSRRQALRRIGGILGGTALASLFPGLALANNTACAHFCASVFGADTPAANQCTSDAAHGKGLCHDCGSAKPSSICCTRNGSGFCTSYSGAHCPCDTTKCLTCQNGACASSCDASQCQTCQNGTCVGCPSGQTCQSGTCVTPHNLFFCFCNDGTFQSTCTAAACFNGAPPTPCPQACANHGGFNSGNGVECQVNAC